MKLSRLLLCFLPLVAVLSAQQSAAPAAAKAVSVPTVDASPAFKAIDWKADPTMTEYAKQAGSRAIADWAADFLSKNLPAKRFAVMRLGSDLDDGYFTSQARNEISSRALGTDYSLYTREDPEWDRIVDAEMKRGDQTGDMMEKSSIQQWGRQTGVQGVIRGRITGVYVGPAKATNAAGVRLADDAKQLQVRIAMQVFEVETGRLLWGGERVAAVMLPGGEIEVGLTRLQLIKYAAYALGGLVALFIVFRLVGAAGRPR